MTKKRLTLPALLAGAVLLGSIPGFAQDAAVKPAPEPVVAKDLNVAAGAVRSGPEFSASRTAPVEGGRLPEWKLPVWRLPGKASTLLFQIDWQVGSSRTLPACTLRDPPRQGSPGWC